MALLYVVLFMAAGVRQRERAETDGKALVGARRHSASGLQVKHRLDNLVALEIIYRLKGHVYGASVSAFTVGEIIAATRG